VLSPRFVSRRRRAALPFWLLPGLLVLPGGARAEEGPPPNFFTALASTTVAYHPNGGSWDGSQHDLTLSLGYGRYFTKTLAFELDLGPTWIDGEYASFSFMPGLVWAFDPHVYLAARFIVPVDPEWNFAVAPGLGLTHVFGNGMAPYLEVNAISYVGKGDPDLGIGVTLGVTIAF
jgi:hypothetical protein